MDGATDPGAPTPEDDETGLIESLRRVDNHLADVVEAQEQLIEVAEQQRTGIERLLEQVTGEDTSLAPDPSTYLFNMSRLVPSGTTENEPVTETREVDYDGVVTEIRVVSTTAAQQAVGAQFGFNSGERVFPRDDPGDARYVPLGEQPIISQPNVEVADGEEVQFKFANNDDSDDHFATALVQIEEDI